MSHRGGPDHADVTSSWFGSLAPLVLLCRVWRMARLGFSGRSPEGARFPPLHSGWAVAPPALGCAVDGRCACRFQRRWCEGL